MAWQIGIIVAPMVMRWLRSLKDAVDEAADQALTDRDQQPLSQQHKKEHTNGTRR